MYKDKIKRRVYVKQWRLKRVLSGWYGKCSVCSGNLGRNEGENTTTGICRHCYGLEHHGKAHSHWIGRKKNNEGYVFVKVNGHPNAQRGGYVAEHRFVVEKRLGRYLYPDEQVHHKNGVRDDNRDENLELRVGAHGSGITIEEAISWAKEIINRYV